MKPYPTRYIGVVWHVAYTVVHLPFFKLMSVIYSAVLHEKDHRKELFFGVALNCVSSAYHPEKIIKMVVDTDTNAQQLIARCRANFAQYLSLSEVIKIVDPSGEIVAIIRSDKFPNLMQSNEK